jgi:plastocyanin
VVPGRSLIGRTAAAAAAGLAIAVLATTPAGAVSRKVGIGDFRWTPGEITVDRGDSVTWFWVGPDTQHSVTGLSANALAWDSDPGNGAPDHGEGDTFKLTFDQPGVYEFHCKLHAIVRGSVVVTDAAGSGAPSPDPDPAIALDVTPPELTDARWSRPAMPYGGGAQLRYTLDEPSRLTFDVLRKRAGRWRLVGTKRFSGHIGWNTWDFAGRLRGRRLAPGRYRGLLVAVDSDNNHTGDVAVPFRVKRRR